MQKTFIGILIVIVIVSFFAVQNSQPVTLSFWFWSVECNLALVLFLSVTFGAITSFLSSLPYRSKKNKAINELKEKIRNLEHGGKQEPHH